MIVWDGTTLVLLGLAGAGILFLGAAYLFEKVYLYYKDRKKNE